MKKKLRSISAAIAVVLGACTLAYPAMAPVFAADISGSGQSTGSKVQHCAVFGYRFTDKHERYCDAYGFTYDGALVRCYREFADALNAISSSECFEAPKSGHAALLGPREYDDYGRYCIDERKWEVTYDGSIVKCMEWSEALKYIHQIGG